MIITISGTMTMDPSVTDAFMAAAAAVSAPTREEEGCLAYHFSLDEIVPGLAHVYEAWTDEDCLHAHLATDHVSTFRASLGALGERVSDIMMYESVPVGPPGSRR